MTRAKNKLTLSRAIYRRTYGEERLRPSIPSRFLAEVPGELIEAASGSLSEPGETRRYEPDPEYAEYSRRNSRYGRDYGYPAAKPRTQFRPPPAPARARKDSLVGTRVRHSKYGVGTIIEVEGEGDERKLTVSFEDYGAKKLVERYANLQIV